MGGLDHNPVSFVSLHVSEIRNALSSGALGISVLGFSSLFLKNDMELSTWVMRLIGLMFVMYAIVYGFRANLALKRYLDYLEGEKYSQLSEVHRSKFGIERWREIMRFHVALYAMMMSVVAVVVVFKLSTLQINVKK